VRRRRLDLGLPQPRLKERLVRSRLAGNAVAVEERDVQTLMTALFKIQSDVAQILRLLVEDDDGEETEEDEP
jgi:hypothetical protein